MKVAREIEQLPIELLAYLPDALAILCSILLDSLAPPDTLMPSTFSSLSNSLASRIL